MCESYFIYSDVILLHVAPKSRRDLLNKWRIIKTFDFLTYSFCIYYA